MELQATKEQEEDGEDDRLAVAKLLIYLSRSNTHKSWPPTICTEGDLQEKKKESASPTTPLSWSGRSGSSGGLCEDGWTASSSSSKRRWESSQRGDQSLLLPSPDPAAELNQELVMAAAAADGGRMASKAFGLKSNCTSSPGDRRQGKRKTVMELRAMKDSLLQEQVKLRKELARQEEIYGVLLEENSSLKKLESSKRSSHNDSGEVNAFPFDLNRLPGDDED